ncbi:MAG: DUF1579 family protein [Deltaproteobacteria bacterium]|nr:DUF1579 family protein [Deltaproteobacteria bacterium]
MKTTTRFGRTFLASLCGLVLFAATAEQATAEKAAAEKNLTVEEVLAKHLEAKGGQAAWDAMTSLRVAGTHTAFGETGSFTLHRQRPTSYLFQFQSPNGPSVIGYDGETAWAIEPVAGHDWALPAGQVDASVIVPEADFAGALLDAKTLGHRVELVGRGDFDGEDTYQLAVHRKDGGMETWHISSDTFLEFARVAPASDYGSPIAEGRTYFLDFRRIGDLMLPHHIEKEYGTRLRISDIDTVTINPGAPKGFFELALPPGQKKLASLAGDWKVKVETRSHPRAPWQETTTTTTINSRFHGALLEENLQFEADGRLQELSHRRTFDRYTGLYGQTLFDNYSLHQDRLEGSLEEGKIVATNLDTGTAWKLDGKTVHTRLTTYDIEKDSFKVDSESSTNGGEKWFLNLRLTYTREP